MSNSHFSRISLDACYLMLFATLWRKEVVEGFYSVFWQGWKGYRKGMCDELRQMGRRQAVWQWREERRRGQSGVGGLGVCVWKNAELKGLEEQNQHLCKHSEELTTHSHTHTRTPVHRHPTSFAVAPLGISSISGCHTGQRLLLEQRLPVALWGYYMV